MKNNNNPGGFEMPETDFGDFELDFEPEFESRYLKQKNTPEIAEHAIKYTNAEKLAQDIIISKNDRYFVVVSGDFIFGDFIEAIITKNDFLVKKMTISTLSLNENNVDSLSILLNNGFCDELDLVVSDYFFSHERKNLVPYIYKELDKSNKFQLAVARIHTKICIFETYCGKKIIFDGSCNLRSSSNIEQFVIEESKELYDFNYEYQMKILDKFKTINKAVRSNQLWKAIK